MDFPHSLVVAGRVISHYNGLLLILQNLAVFVVFCKIVCILVELVLIYPR